MGTLGQSGQQVLLTNALFSGASFDQEHLICKFEWRQKEQRMLHIHILDPGLLATIFHGIAYDSNIFVSLILPFLY